MHIKEEIMEPDRTTPTVADNGWHKVTFPNNYLSASLSQVVTICLHEFSDLVNDILLKGFKCTEKNWYNDACRYWDDLKDSNITF